MFNTRTFCRLCPMYGLHVLSALNKDSALLLPGHGYCSCGRCICQDGWFGKVCQFPRSCDMSDAQSREHCETADGVVCNGKGEQIVFDCALKVIFLSKARVFTFSSHVAQQCATCEQQCHKWLPCFSLVFWSRKNTSDVPGGDSQWLTLKFWPLFFWIWLTFLPQSSQDV